MLFYYSIFYYNTNIKKYLLYKEGDVAEEEQRLIE
jgi:hypothetical protein